ncbi:aminopeptidase N [Pseudobacteriovorax antillogorgiicola]|uniref:Aminopeptidase N n=1 Tax=Pseudobacteriovorax antillogorgiicola TaxID=1513793 RepID=A0A1Y6BX95_9BACT|nr:aminopeptidase N [Pseudobacteriovorax antillogorgiicola]TCS50319.1 aminopeptidase N [Pseudobacteriovorax antillogorgiicola]SMF34169.1 aminopeptidase N [Pseudobacteriovorax antillogorgiicola]
MSREPQVIKLKDYQQPNFWAKKTELTFDLNEDHSLVTSKVHYQHNPGHDRTLTLAGLSLELVSVHLDHEDLNLDAMDYSPEHLSLKDLPDTFALTITTKIYPQKNTALEGLYKSNGKFCTQCEPEGFRRITYFLDRPDVMSEYRTTIIADKSKYPILLSNGNPVDSKDLPNNRHQMVWHDPFPKPSYLFALVAGDLGCVEDEFTTKSSRKIKLQIFVEKENLDKCDFAMQAVKDSMKWDEDTYGLEYDLDIFMIVAVSDFNMGAMENKGLNIFNSKYILANPETATDSDFEGIQSVVGHEYFHNWSGNRVTCRDWFQLSLKEGLTVFRDQEFSADMNSRGVKRISDVKVLRNSQFVEDSGPMAHPVRPDSYIEINNFYTSTVYNKGAEVIRMIHTILGKDAFHKGIDTYFNRHDGEAATIEDFVKAMEDSSGASLKQFTHWYHQAGTPRVNAELSHQDNKVILKLQQRLPMTPGQSDKHAQVIPITTSFFAKDGKAVPFLYQGDTKTEHVLIFDQGEQEFVFEGFAEEPIPSLARSFSAPIHLDYQYSDEQLIFLMTWDNDDFNRYEAAQNLAMSLMKKRQQSPSYELPDEVLTAYKSLLASKTLDPRIKARALSFPSIDYLVSLEQEANIEAIFETRSWLQESIGHSCYQELWDAYHQSHKQDSYQLDAEGIGNRELKSVCLSLLLATGKEDSVALATSLFAKSNNMTDTITALNELSHVNDPRRQDAFKSFYDKWSHDQLVIDKWFALQSSSYHDHVLAHVKDLLEHKDFDLLNPNRVYAVLRQFARANPKGFHHSNGEGYQLIADYVLKIDKTNSHIAAMLANSLSQWRRFDKGRQGKMVAQLERIKAAEGLSKDVYEIVSKSLQDS